MARIENVQQETTTARIICMSFTVSLLVPRMQRKIGQDFTTASPVTFISCPNYSGSFFLQFDTPNGQMASSSGHKAHYRRLATQSIVHILVLLLLLVIRYRLRETVYWIAHLFRYRKPQGKYTITSHPSNSMQTLVLFGVDL